ncbi:Cysteine desulfurase IscS [Durusdinium trenchii]|uniref:cysteine desulfurase n=1 Tax=Durusdinium trenchii TaxID=1381693 RepID=A0ABP0HQJ3_9DINO
MSGIKRILVGVDLVGEPPVAPSPTQWAIEQALQAAQTLDAEVTFMTVLDGPPVDTEAIVTDEQETLDRQGHAEQLHRELVSQASARSVTAHSQIVFGRSWYEMIRAVLRDQFDLVVVGTREHGPAHRMLFGSTAVKLFRKCPCPVWVTRPDANPDKQTVLAAHDFSDVGDEVLNAAICMAQVIDGRLMVLHAAETPLRASLVRTECPQDEIDAYVSKVRSEAEAELQKRLAMTDFRTVQAGTKIEVTTGKPELAIEKAIEEEEVDILVMGTSGRGGVPGFFLGNTAERLLPTLTCSVLAIKPAGFHCPVFDAMRPWWTDRAANPASTSHQCGLSAAAAIDEARGEIANALNADPSEVIFTSGATEANNLALKGCIGDRPEGTHLIVNAIEESLVPETSLVSVMLANNEVGSINPVAQIAEAAHSAGALVHCDASQAVGKIPVDVRELGVDLLSFTAHKLYGPPGIGALVVRRRHRPVRLTPLFDGGGHEQGRRSGTLPTPLVIGFAAAVRLAVAERERETHRIRGLRDRLWASLCGWRSDLRRNGEPEQGLPGNLNVTIPAVDGEALLVRLRESQLAISSGAACTSANPEPSHVLRAMGLREPEARASVRFGIGRFNTTAEIDRAVQILRGCVDALS